MRKPFTFKVQLNNGPVLEVKIKSGLYVQAVAVAFAMHDFKPNGCRPNVAKVWIERLIRLIPEYGPYYYAWDGSGNYAPISKDEAQELLNEA